MLQTTLRDNRVFDGVVVQNLSTSPSFFASTTILIIGGLLAVLSTTERASELVREIPFAARTSVLVFDLKVVLLTAIFVYAFFRFTWSLRQYTFGALLVAARPTVAPGRRGAARGLRQRAGRVMGLAAETFNDGLRAYYMAFAALAWFFSPWAMVWMAGTTLGVVWILYRREFHSEVLADAEHHPLPDLASATSRLIGARPQLVQAISRSAGTNCSARPIVAATSSGVSMASAGHVDDADHHVLALQQGHQVGWHMEWKHSRLTCWMLLAASAGKTFSYWRHSWPSVFFQSTLAWMP
jgi:uncharacterized membrane protein